MKSGNHETVNISEWYKRLLQGKVFGTEKDKLILRILKLGGRSELENFCGVRFSNKKVMIPHCAPTLEEIKLALAGVEAVRKETEKRWEKAKHILANAKDFDKKTIASEHRTNYSFSIEQWTPREKKD
jgi:hypothetical protein